MADRALAVILERVRQRLLWIAGLAGGLWAISAAALCVLVGVWLDLLLELPPGLRLAWLAVAAVVSLVLFGGLCVYAIRQASAAALARRLDSAAGTKGEILSGVELSTKPPQAAEGTRPELTAGLAKIAVRRATRLASRVPRKTAVPLRPFQRSLIAWGCFAAAMLAAIFVAPRLAMTQWLRFADPYGDHPPYSRVSFEVDPTEATVFYGESVEVNVATAGPPVESVSLVFRAVDRDRGDELELPMFPETDGTWRATIANVTANTEFFVRAGRARSEKYRVEVITDPLIEDVKFRITPPAYTRGAVYEGTLPQGGIAGLPGTRVSVAVRSNRPLKSGRLVYRVGETHRATPLLPEAGDPQTVRGEVDIDAAGRMELSVVDTDGQQSRPPFVAPVVLLDDERPFVRLLQPREISFATPTAVMPVTIAAEDDYGISRLQLFRNLNDSRHLPMDIPLPTEPPTRFTHVVPLALAAYGLQPGDEIKLFARVEDNDPVAAEQTGGGKGAESTIVTIRIIAPEALQQLQRSRDGMKLLLSKYQQAQRRMEALAAQIQQLQEELKKQQPESPLSEEIRQKLQQLSERMRAEHAALDQLVKQQLPYEMDKQLTPKLQEMADRLQRLQKKTDELAQRQQDAQLAELQQQLAEMLEQLHNEQRQAEQQMMEPLKLLEDAVALMRDQLRFTLIYHQQRALAERLKSLKGRDQEDDPELKARMRDLQEEQQKLRAELEEVLEDIEQHAAALPEDDPTYTELRESAQQFVAELRKSGAAEAMDEASSGLADFSGTDGHASAKHAADILEKFLKQGQGMGQAAGNSLRFQPGLGQSLSTTAEQLLADAGLNPGMGGQLGGGSGGYSTRRSTLNNVGLYGGLPQMDDAGSGSGEPQDGLVGGARGRGQGTGGGRPGGVIDPTDSDTASGVGEAAIPLRYRRKVGRYFQQIADEVGEQ